MNSKSVFRQATLMAVCATAFAAAGAQAADSIVFTSWGGTTQSSQDKDWAKPFTKATGINVMMDGPTDYGKLKAMVDSGNVTWDVVDVEGDFAYAAQKAGLVEPIDYSVVKKDELDPRFVSPAAVGSFYYAFVLGFNKASFKGRSRRPGPTSSTPSASPASAPSISGRRPACSKSRCWPMACR